MTKRSSSARVTFSGSAMASTSSARPTDTGTTRCWRQKACDTTPRLAVGMTLRERSTPGQSTSSTRARTSAASVASPSRKAAEVTSPSWAAASAFAAACAVSVPVRIR